MTEDSEPLTEADRTREEEKARDILVVVANLVGGDLDAAARVLTPDLRQFRSSGPKLSFKRTPAHWPLVPIRGGHVFCGGAGVVVECFLEQDLLPSRRVAFKCPRPSKATKDLDALAHASTQARLEVARTAEMGHPNVPPVINADRFDINTFDPRRDLQIALTCSLTDWIDDPMGFEEHLTHRAQSLGDVVSAIRQVLNGLAYIHSKGLIHWDIKSANCLVGSDSVVRLTDLGNARPIAGKGVPAGEVAYTSKENVPSFFQSVGGPDPESPNRIAIDVGKQSPAWDRPCLDLSYAGRMFGRALGFEPDHPAEAREFLDRVFPGPTDELRDESLHALEFLEILCFRLTSFDSAGNSYYDSASTALRDLEKLELPFGDASHIRELLPVAQHVVRLADQKNSPYSGRVSEAVNSDLLANLSGHLQLGLTRHAYPGAFHVRFEHVLGVLHETVSFVQALYSDRTSPFFRLLIQGDDIRALLLAALLHDIGHGAFSHYLEEMHPLFDGVAHEDFAQVLLRKQERSYGDFGAPAEMRRLRRCLEDLTKQGWLADRGEATESAADAEVGRFLVRVADVLRPPPYPASPPEEKDILTDRASSDLAALWILHSIIDSAIDADKLDYLRRDAVHSGLAYASGTDLDRFFQSLTTVLAPPLPGPSGVRRRGRAVEPAQMVPFRPSVAITKKGILPVEGILIARYQMFSSLYWQHTARSATVAVQWLVRQYLGGPRRGFRQRRAHLLDHFRRLPDRDALLWLDSELKATIKDSAEAAHAQSLLAGALLRRGLPSPALELSYPRVSAEQTYGTFEGVMQAHADLHHQGPDDYLSSISRIEGTIRERVHGTVGTDPGLVLIDIPSERKDQVENLFVIDRGSQGRVVREFARFSPISEAISMAFRYWARPARVFVLPSELRIANTRTKAGELERTVEAALFEAYGHPRML